MKQVICMVTVFVFSFLQGCSSTSKLNAVDKLTRSASNDGIYNKPVQFYPLQSRFLAINGQIPVYNVGVPCLADGYRPVYSMVCFSLDKTKQYQYNFTSTITMNELASIRTDLTKLETASIQVVKALLEKGKCISEAQCEQGSEKTKSLDKNIKSKQELLTRLKGELESKLSQENIFIFNWSAQTNAGSGAGLRNNTEQFSASLSNKESGYTIVGGLRMTQLLVGNDFNKTYELFPKQTKVSTLTLEAQKILYSNSLDFSLALNVDASFSDLTNYFQKLTTTEQAHINFLINIGRSITNQGQFSNTESKAGQVPFANNQTKGYQTFYVTMTDIKGLTKLSEKFQKDTNS